MKRVIYDMQLQAASGEIRKLPQTERGQSPLAVRLKKSPKGENIIIIG